MPFGYIPPKPLVSTISPTSRLTLSEIFSIKHCPFSLYRISPLMLTWPPSFFEIHPLIPAFSSIIGIIIDVV